jgi:hypothetical protein
VSILVKINKNIKQYFFKKQNKTNKQRGGCQPWGWPRATPGHPKPVATPLLLFIYFIKIKLIFLKKKFYLFIFNIFFFIKMDTCHHLIS